MDNAIFNNEQVLIVSDFFELVNTPFQDKKNAICWHRNLQGDFEEIVLKLQLKENITEIFPPDLLSLSLSEKGMIAKEIILNDLQLLTNFGAQPSLNLLKNYERDDVFDFISTDVYSYHVDRSPIGTDTFLCTYYGAASEIISNEEVVQKILIPEIRDKLLEIYDEQEGDFEEFLKENFFDLHYAALTGSQPVNLGNGHLWRLAVEHPEQQVLPCVHRAPVENNGEYRLLLIC